MKTMARFPLIGVSVEREEIAVDVMHSVRVPDEAWTFVDKKGHGHFWKGKKVPTCKYVKVGEQVIGDEYESDVVPIHEWQCRGCGETIEPGYRTEYGPTHVPGPTWITVTINDENFVVTPEQYASTVEVWRDALKVVA